MRVSNTIHKMLAEEPLSELERDAFCAHIGAARGIPDPGLNWIFRIEESDGEPLENAVRVALLNFHSGCVEDGLLPMLQHSGVLGIARTLDGASVPMRGNDLMLFNFVGADYGRLAGLAGDGVNKFAALGVRSDAIPQDDFSCGLWVVSADANAGTRAYIGAGGANAGAVNITRASITTKLGFRNRSATGNNSTADWGSATGYVGMRRTGSANYEARALGANEMITQVSQTPDIDNLVLFRRASTGLESTTASSSVALGFYHAGTAGPSEGLALLDARLTTLFAAVTEALT